MTDADFAAELARRLTRLIYESPEVRQAVAAVLRVRIELGPSQIGDALIGHPTIQVFSAAPRCAQLGALGILNGLLASMVLRSSWDDVTGDLAGFEAVPC